MGSSSLVTLGLHDPTVLEAIACREGIALAEDLNLHSFVIACDSKQVVCDITNSSIGRYGPIISRIKSRLEKL